jgi:ABC-type branched-subunit amino acid transport system substrate-binding protein
LLSPRGAQLNAIRYEGGTRRLRGMAVVMASLALVAATLVSSSHDAASASTGKAAKGTPIKIEVIGPFTLSAAPQQASLDAVQIQAKLLNAKGGINGHPVKVIGCDDETDPNVGASCAQQAVSNHVVAVMGSFSLVSSAIWPILNSARIPFLGVVQYAPEDTTDAESYPVMPSTDFADAAAFSYLFKYQHCTAVADVTDNEGADTDFTTKLDTDVSVADGGTYVGPYYETVTAGIANVDPLAASILAKASCADVSIGSAGIPLIQELLQLDPTFQVSAGEGSLPGDWPTELGAADASHVHTIGSIAATNSTAPGMEAYDHYMALDAKGTYLGEYSESTWAAFYVFTEAAEAIKGKVTNLTFKAELKKSSSLSTEGMTAPLNYTQPKTVGPMTREFSTFVILEGASNGKVVKVSDLPSNLVSIPSS